MSDSALLSLVIVTAIAVVAPMLSDHVLRWIFLPSIVVELLLGILIGPSLLGWVEADHLEAFSQLGLGLLIFLAGYEIDFAKIRGRPARLAVTGWLVSLALGLAIGFLLRGPEFRSLVVGLALTTTALGTILPIVRDTTGTNSPFGVRVLANGAIGEFGPIVAIALLLTSSHPTRTAVLLIVFFLLAMLAAFLAARPRSARLSRLLTTTLGTSAQLAVRLVLLIVVSLVWVAAVLGLDVLLGAFAAGVIVRLAVQTMQDDFVGVVESKLEAVGFGFFIPIFFVISGVTFDLESLIKDPLAAAKIPLFLLLFLVVRGIPVWFFHRKELGDQQRNALALFSACALPLVVAITNIGVEADAINEKTAAALVGAGVLSVLLFPIGALRLVRSRQATKATSQPRVGRVSRL